MPNPPHPARPDPPLPAGGASREEIALREVGHTDVTPRTARLLVILFLILVAIVPLVEWAGIRTRREQGEEPSWVLLQRLPRDVGARLASVPSGTGLWARVVAGNRRVLETLGTFEDALEDESAIGRSLRPPAQYALTRWLGAGNERVYTGVGGWLFYRPDVEHITGRPFLDRRRMDRRIASASEWDRPPQPDPRPALYAFKRDLAARGITLIVMPTPVKPAVHPGSLGPSLAERDGLVQNPSYAAFVDELRANGVLVFEAGEALAASRRFGPQYLETDTHWRPEAMEEVADLLARFVTAHADLPARESPAYRVERTEVRNAGDTARMLDLPGGWELFLPESVWLRRVLQEDGTLWRSSREADVLLLGDSFTNIYSLESMGWGTSAGLAEQLSDALGRPVDRLVQNDDAAFATRAMLWRDPARLTGKRVVIYQFAARELSFGDWRLESRDAN
jgi:hypothetical protein